MNPVGYSPEFGNPSLSAVGDSQTWCQSVDGDAGWVFSSLEI
jgi:hypothetical protein